MNQEILFIPLNLDNLYLEYLRNFLYSYMIISKFMFRVPYSIISQEVIDFAIYLSKPNTRVLFATLLYSFRSILLIARARQK